MEVSMRRFVGCTNMSVTSPVFAGLRRIGDVQYVEITRRNTSYAMQSPWFCVAQWRAPNPSILLSDIDLAGASNFMD
jgi:hypothetical protein